LFTLILGCLRLLDVLVVVTVVEIGQIAVIRGRVSVVVIIACDVLFIRFDGCQCTRKRLYGNLIVLDRQCRQKVGSIV
jgi:hypothetical protein